MWPCLPCSVNWASRSSSGSKLARTSLSRASGASWARWGLGAMNITAVLALWPIAKVAHNAYGSPRVEPETHRAKDLLRRVASRRRGRCELGLVSAMVRLLQQDKTLYDALSPHVKLK